ncbi:DUF2972 domain-containing protein, partial [Campylobacter jejuni]|nr:DUF2972 domain-containing protein [Campylobacter jejuni]EKM2522459.1 DUF2972 domain-containing protein [Campylobacter jejuni]MEG77362.1 DUF2972 domain-containing protein [Campylobacter jejuni]
YKIKKQHKKEQKIYQQTIQVFPQLKYPNLETCSDYEQALKYKFHLSYMLGEVLIQTFQNLHKGSMFKLAKNIKKANKEFKIFKEIFNNFAKLSPNIIKIISKNKQAFLKELPRIQNILKIHQDYQPILDNIFHNFNYFIQNFNLIEEWLLSNDFNEKYKKENHPYPSLLDPKKLNDEKEKINYKNIPAELAWEMNLPLPDNYEFVYMRNFGAGGSALNLFFQKCGFKVRFSQRIKAHEEYLEMFIFLISCYHEHAVLTLPGFPIDGREKLCYMIQKRVKCICIVRDPISIYKTLVNHRGYMPDRKIFFNQNESFKNIFTGIRYRFYDRKKNIVISYTYPTLDSLYSPVYIDKGHERFNLTTKINLLYSISDLVYIDMKKILPGEIKKTLPLLSEQFNINLPKDIYSYFEQPLNGGKFVYLLPKTLIIEKSFIKEKFHTIVKENVKILITQSQFLNSSESSMINITCLFDNIITLNNILIYIKHEEGLLKNLYFITFIRRYLGIVVKKLLIHSRFEELKLFKEKDVLNYLKENKELRVKLKNILDKELVHIKQHRPDIVASWKYYQEFEQMCKELDW